MHGTPERLTVLYDEQCALCRRCRHWLEHQSTYVPLDFLAAGTPAARERYGEVPWLGAELVVVSEAGDLWVGPAAFLVALWATVDYRRWSYRLSGRALAPLAERFFHLISSNRKRIGAMVGSRDCPDGRCHHRDEQEPAYAPVVRGLCRHCGSALAGTGTHCWSCGAWA
jgi:predicted DCC family thiol-disulfide oxidoreductase YuxK